MIYNKTNKYIKYTILKIGQKENKDVKNLCCAILSLEIVLLCRECGQADLMNVLQERRPGFIEEDHII